MKDYKKAIIDWFVKSPESSWTVGSYDFAKGVRHEVLYEHLKTCQIDYTKTQPPELGTEYGYDSLSSHPPEYPCLETDIYCKCGEILGRRMAMTSIDMTRVIYEVIQEGLSEDAKGDPG